MSDKKDRIHIDQASPGNARDGHAMQQYLTEYDHHRAFLVVQSQDQPRPEATTREMQQWELEWQRKADSAASNTS